MVAKNYKNSKQETDEQIIERIGKRFYYIR